MGSDLLAQIGGRPTVDALIDGLYDRIEADPGLRRLFGRHLRQEREGQKRFFGEWLGGDSAYSERAYWALADRHALSPISGALAEQWLGHFRAALETVVADPEARAAIETRVSGLALALVNDGDPPAPIRAQSHGTCLRYAPAIESLALARRGEAAALGNLVGYAPDVLAAPAHTARLLHLAALNGRTAVVKLLLDMGVDVNQPSPIQLVGSLIFVTPLAAARLRRRTDVEAVLLERGACEDIFTHAFLGELTGLVDDLAGDASLAQANDPAVDALAITPIHHAVAGGRVAALRVLLACVSGPVINAARALRDAVTREHVPMVELLLERGVDASSIGAGRWVLHRELAHMLSQAGAGVDRSGGWIGLACTGNQGRSDDPEYVAALLRYGARVDDRRGVGQDHDGGRATALHYAAKAGFLNTLEVLLAHGADPSARDDNGQTPLEWLARSTKSVDRAAVRRRLLRRP